MGYGFMGYRVDIGKITTALGSKDDKLLRMMGGRFKREIARLDDSFDSDIESSGVNTQEALRRLIYGETAPTDKPGHLYAYAFKLIVEHFGNFLSNGSLYPVSVGYEDEIDKGLASIGVTAVSLSDIAYGRIPGVTLPRVDDFPGKGAWTAEQVAAAHAQFAAAPPLPEGTDSDIRDAVADVRAWVNAAHEKGWGVIGFYH